MIFSRGFDLCLGFQIISTIRFHIDFIASSNLRRYGTFAASFALA